MDLTGMSGRLHFGVWKTKCVAQIEGGMAFPQHESGNCKCACPQLQLLVLGEHLERGRWWFSLQYAEDRTPGTGILVLHSERIIVGLTQE